MKVLKKGFIVQFVGVLTLVFGNFYTAGAAVADVVSTDEIAAKNAKLIDDKRQLVSNAKVGDKANLAFDTTVGSLSQAGKVKFEYDQDVLRIDKKKYKFHNGRTQVVVDVDGKDSTIQWKHAVGRTDLEVVLPVKFNQAVDHRELTFAVDEKEVKLPTLTVVDKDSQKSKETTTSDKDKVDGNLQDDDLVNKVLAEAERDEAASDQAEAEYAKKQAEEAQKQADAKQKEADKKEEATEQPVAEEPKKEAEIDENSSQADAIDMPEKSDADKAKAFVKEKREADEKAAEEKSRQAIEERKKDNENRSQDPTQNDQKTLKNSGDTREIQTPQDSSLANVDSAKKVLSGSDDAEAGDVDGDSLKGTLPVNGVFAEGRDLGKLSYFFDTIQLKYGKNNDQTWTVEGDLSKDVEIPADIRDSENITIYWAWNTQNINEMNKLNPPITDNDYYEFDIKGFEYLYPKDTDFESKDITDGNKRKIGTFTISKGETKDVQRVRITFLPGANTAERRIEYKANAKTVLSQGAEEVTFGEIARDAQTIKVKKGLLSLSKTGKYETREDSKQTVTDYSKLHWTSNFETAKDNGGNYTYADSVTLQDVFGSGYNYMDAVYEFEVTPNEGDSKKISKDNDETLYNKILKKVSSTTNFTFNAKDIFSDGEKIKAIQIDMVANITDYKPSEYENEIKVTSWKSGSSEMTSHTARAKVENDRKMLNKTAEVVKGGNVEYTVGFTVRKNDTNLTLTDELTSVLFKYDKSTFRLYQVDGEDRNEVDLSELSEDHTINEPSGEEPASFSLKFNDGIKPTDDTPTLYELVYQVTPVDPSTIKDTDYENLTNKVTWNGTSEFTNIKNPTFNTKTAGKSNWSNFTTNWTLEVNKYDRNVGFPITIVEPVNDSNYLDFEGYFDEILEKANANAESNTLNIDEYIQLATKNDQDKYQLRAVEFVRVSEDVITFKWKGSETAAFTLEKNGSDQIELKILSSPEDSGTHNFQVKWLNVPINKKALAKSANVSTIENCANIKYRSETKKVCASIRLPNLVRKNISKEGELSKDFNDPTTQRQIHWTSSFNFKDYLGDTDTYTVTDKFGDDTVDVYDGRGHDEASRQFQSIEYNDDNPSDYIKLSLGKLNEDGTKITEYAGGDEFEEGEHYHLTLSSESTEFELKITLTSAGKQFIKDKGYNICVLKYSSDVKDLSFSEDEDTYDHLKKWTFNNDISVSGLTDQDLTAHAQTTYTDAGYLLDKGGQAEKFIDDGREITAVKWNLLVNGEGKNLDGEVKIVDQITGDNQNHLNINNSDYHVKVYKAIRTINSKTGEVTYEADKKNPIDSSKYSFTLSESLDQLEINFTKDFRATEPLIVQYYTEIQTTTGKDFTNDVTLSLGNRKYTAGETLQSGLDTWGNVNHFSVNVIKTADESGEPLEGVKFKLQQLKNNKWEDVMTPSDDGTTPPRPYKVTTNEQGMATFMDLEALPTYRIVETEGPADRFTQYESKPFTMKDVEDGKAVYVLKAVNPYPGNLIIKKTVESNGIDISNEAFKFDVTAVDGVGASMTNFNASFNYEIYDRDGNPVMDDNNQPLTGTVTFVEGVATDLPAIKDDQQIKIIGLPQNQSFKITELDADKFTTSNQLTNISSGSTQEKNGKATGQFTLLKGKTVTNTIAEFVNQIEPGDFSFSKSIKGPNAENDGDKEFEFYLEAIGKDSEVDRTFSGKIEGMKHSGGQDKKVTFNFENGRATTLNDDETPIKLKDKESYDNIKLPANMRFRVYERQDGTYKHTSYAINGDDKGEAASESDEEGDNYHVVGPIYTNGKQLKFTNEQKENSFEFEKMVSGTTSEDKFKFEIASASEATKKAIANETFKAALVNASEGTPINDNYQITFDENGKATEWKLENQILEDKAIAIKHDQKVVITGLPIEADKFTVTELASGDDWNVSYQLDGDHERKGNKATLELNREKGDNSILFRNLEPNMVSFKIKKTISGVVPPKDSEFKFNLTIKNPKENWGEKKDFRAVKSGDMKEFDLPFTRSSDGTYTASQTLKADESLTIFTLKGLQVNVEEENHQGYDVSYQYGDHRGDGHAYEITTGDGDCGQACLPPLIFNNHVPGTAVEIEKQLAGKTLVESDYDKKFHFNVQGTDNGDENLNGNFDIEVTTAGNKVLKGTVTFDDGRITSVVLDGEDSTKEIVLKSGEKAKILGLPDGAEIKVIELANSHEGFDSSYVLNKKDSRPGNETISFETHEDEASTVQFINTKQVPKTTNLQLSKKVLGNGKVAEDSDKKFEFVIGAIDPEGKLKGKEYDATKLNYDGSTSKLKVEFEIDEETNKPQYKVTLQDTEELNIKGLPLDVKFNVEEMGDEDEEFETTHIVNKTQLMDGNKTIDFNLREEGNTVEFINTKHLPETCGLLIEKQLDGTGITEADENETFDFQVVTDLVGKFKATKFNQDGSHTENLDIEFEGGKSGNISLKSDERLIIYGLPLETQFSVTELGANDFKTTWNVNSAKTHDGKATNDFKLVKEATVPVLFTNTKQAPDTANLKISKKLAGDGLTDADKDRVFNFRIYSGASGTYKAVKTQQNGHTSNTTINIQNGQSDVITLRADESLNATGLPIEHTYAVGEQYVGDYAASYKVNGGTVTNGMTTDFFKMIADQNGTVEFTNTKDGDIGMGSFSVNKFVNETGDRTRAFNFSLEAVDGAGSPLDGTFETQTTTNGGTPTSGMINITGGNAKFTLTHGQSIKFVLPMGARYEVSEQDYTKDGYVTTVTKRGAAYTGTHVFGTATGDNDAISYHNDIEEDEAELPLPADEDTPDSSATLDEPDALPASDGTNGTSGSSGTNGITSPQGLPSAGYTGKQALPQTGEANDKLYTIIGAIALVMLAVIGTIYYTKRKNAK